MKKILMITLLGVGLLTQSVEASVPNLTDWVLANQNLSKEDQELGRAADVLMWANTSKEFKHRGKKYNLFFPEGQRSNFEHIMKAFPSVNYSVFIDALRNGDLNLVRDDVLYTLTAPDKTDLKVNFYIFLQSGHVNFVRKLAPEIAKQFVKGVRKYDIDRRFNVYKAYTEREDANSETVEQLLVEAKKLDEYRKSSVYRAYIERENANPETIEQLLVEARRFTSVSNKSFVYVAYIKRENANPETVEGFVAEARKFTWAYYQSLVYETYIKRADANPATVERLLEDARKFSEDDRAEIYLVYMKLCYCDTNMVQALIEEIKTFKNAEIRNRTLDEIYNEKRNKSVKSARR